MAKLDVKGALKNPVYIKCEGKWKDLIVQVLPKMRQYLAGDGILYYKLYGCVQASKLQYLKLSVFLEKIGYLKCDVEPFIFCKVVDDRMLILIVHVDDILNGHQRRHQAPTRACGG